MVDEGAENQGDTPEKESETSPGRKKRPGEVYRDWSLYSATTIIIVYPVVGFIVGWLMVRFWHWPAWVPALTTVAGVVEGIREVYKLSKKVLGDNND